MHSLSHLWLLKGLAVRMLVVAVASVLLLLWCSVWRLPSLLVHCHSSLHLTVGCRARCPVYPLRVFFFLLHVAILIPQICHCSGSTRGLPAPNWIAVSTPISCQVFVVNLSEGIWLLVGLYHSTVVTDHEICVGF